MLRDCLCQRDVTANLTSMLLLRQSRQTGAPVCQGERRTLWTQTL